MKARKRNSNDEWQEIKYVQLEDSDILYKEEYIEFQHDNLSTEPKTFDQTEEEKHWQDVRERAAIAAMQRTMDMITHDYQSYHNIVVEGFTGKKKTFPNEIAEFSVACADALVEQLKTK